MITGTSQADCAVLIVAAGTGKADPLTLDIGQWFSNDFWASHILPLSLGQVNLKPVSPRTVRPVSMLFSPTPWV